MRRNWYTCLLLVSLLLAGGWKIDTKVQAWQQAQKVAEAVPQENVSEEAEAEQPMEAVSREADAEDEENGDPVIPEIDASFDGVLFVGDSRTDGLSEYGHLGNADVFADSGLSSYTAMTKSLQISDEDERTFTLEELLGERQYKLILIMLGINELGYDHRAAVRKYGELVDRIQELQPEAYLVLEANLHMTEAKSEGDDIFNNESINEINGMLRQMAAEKNMGWLDANELFDDENGNLRADFSADGAHILGKYYKEWSDWILQKLKSGSVK